MSNGCDKIRGLEFIGLPGSGKTTVMHEVQSSLRVLGQVEIFSNEDLDLWKRRQGNLGKAQLLFENPLFAAKHIQKAFSIMLSLDKVDLRTCKRVVETPLYYLYVQKITSEYCRFIMTDQWIIQSIWSFAALPGKYNQNLLLDYTRIALRLSPFAYVYIKASPEVAAGRIAKRTNGGSRFDKCSYNENITKLTRANELLERMQQLLKEEKAKVLILDAEDTTSLKASKVMEFMSPFAKLLLSQHAPG